MKTIDCKKVKGEWIASYHGQYIASGKTKPACMAAATDYLLQVFDNAWNTPMVDVSSDGSVFIGKQVLDDQYSIIRNNGGSAGGTGKLTREYFDKWVSDYNQATA